MDGTHLETLLLAMKHNGGQNDGQNSQKTKMPKS